MDIAYIVRFLGQLEKHSVKFASTAIKMTFEFAYNVDINELLGIRARAVRKAAAAARSPVGKSLADITALDPILLTRAILKQEDLTLLSDSQLRDTTITLLASRAGLRPSDIRCIPGGSVKFISDPDGNDLEMTAKLAIYNGKTSGSEDGVSRHGWTQWVNIYPLRVRQITSIYGDSTAAAAIVNKACTVKALHEMDRRVRLRHQVLPLEGYPAKLGGRSCLNPGMFECCNSPGILTADRISNILKARLVACTGLTFGRSPDAFMEVYHLRHSTAVNLEMVGCTAAREQRLTQENPDRMWRNHYGLLQQSPAFKIRLAALHQWMPTARFERLNADERLLI
jgi:hypothetical protein